MPQKQKPIVLVILGPTASGKSDLAVTLAQKYNGEVISADSRQVYKNLDIGTGKITTEEMHGIPHYLLNVTSPKKVFTVFEYQKRAEKAIRQIIKKGKIPIICGGTGFYIDSITRGFALPQVPPNKKLRKELEQKNNNELLNILESLDKKRALDIQNKNEINNRVRLIRAIEIARALGQVPEIKEKNHKYNFIKIGLFLDNEFLKKKIEKRVNKMFQDGLLDEIEQLKKQGVSEQRLKEFGFEYHNPTIDSVIRETNKYVKRQLTWFKRDKEIVWLKPSDVSAYLKSYLTSADKKQKLPKK